MCNISQRRGKVGSANPSHPFLSQFLNFIPSLCQSQFKLDLDRDKWDIILVRHEELSKIGVACWKKMCDKIKGKFYGQELFFDGHLATALVYPSPYLLSSSYLTPKNTQKGVFKESIRGGESFFYSLLGILKEVPTPAWRVHAKVATLPFKLSKGDLDLVRIRGLQRS